jgi:hypothetical protein
MSERENLFKSITDSDSKSKYKSTKELSKLIRGAKRECYPGIPHLTEHIYVEDEQGLCSISPDGMDWLELSLLVMNKAVWLPGQTKRELAELRIFIPEKYSVN